MYRLSKKKICNSLGTFNLNSDAWFEKTAIQIRREIDKASSDKGPCNIDKEDKETKK